MAENDIIVAKEGSGGTLSEIALAPSDIGAANASHAHTATDIDSGASAAGTFLQSNGSGGAGWNTVSYEDLDDVPSSFTPASHASSHAAAGSDPVFDQNLNTTDAVSFSAMSAESLSVYNATDDFSVELDASGGLSDDRTLQLPDASGTIALTDDIPDPSSATPQALGTASAGTSDDYSRADHIHGAPALNDLSNVSAAAPSDNDVLVFDNATSTWVAEAPAAGGSSIMQSIAVGFVLN